MEVRPDRFILAEKLCIGGDGLRVAVKDTLDIAGYRTIAGSRSRVGAPVATGNADIVDRILAAGCHIVGKAALHELAYGVTGINAAFGTPVNPEFPDLVPGGSSSGSAAAVAAGLADFSIGTDTGGSIRIPAACCGVFGLKPTFGRVSRRGAQPVESSLDCIGPFARTINLIESAMTIMDPSFHPLEHSDIRIGLVEVDCEMGVRQAVRDAVIGSGVKFKPLALEALDESFRAGLTVIGFETYRAFGHLLATGQVGVDVADRLHNSGRITAAELAQAEIVRQTFRDGLDRVFMEVDILCMPTLPGLPPTLEEARADTTAPSLTRLVRPFNLSGHPALAMPIGVHRGRPVSLQIVGRHGEDELVCAAARKLGAV
jgi:amidase